MSSKTGQARIAVLLTVLLGLAAGPLGRGVSAQQMLPRDLEMELAESALPLRLRAEATVYVLDSERGFQVAREGSNGFHAFVSRLDWAVFWGTWDYSEHPSDVIVPIAFDPAGARQPMRAIFDAHELHARGTPAPRVKEIIRQRFLLGVYKPHERAGVAYMLAPVIRAYPDPLNSPQRVTASLPHRMFYAPNIDNEDIGGVRLTNNPFVIQPGPHGYIVVLASEAEKSAINEEYAVMLRRLCELNELYCLGG